jgi:hypothetical protein
VPCTIDQALAWQQGYDAGTQAALVDAAEAQELLSDTLFGMTGIRIVVNVLASISGSVGGFQTLSGIMTEMMTLLARAQVVQAPLQEQKIRKEMRGEVLQQIKQVLAHNQVASLQGQPRRTCTPLPVMATITTP